MTSKISKVKAIHNQLEVCSMMRSGHHAVLYWLFAQINHPIYFRNDVLCYRDERSLKDRGVVIGGKNISSILKTYIYNVEDIPINNIKRGILMKCSDCFHCQSRQNFFFCNFHSLEVYNPVNAGCKNGLTGRSKFLRNIFKLSKMPSLTGRTEQLHISAISCSVRVA